MHDGKIRPSGHVRNGEFPDWRGLGAGFEDWGVMMSSVSGGFRKVGNVWGSPGLGPKRDWFVNSLAASRGRVAPFASQLLHHSSLQTIPSVILLRTRLCAEVRRVGHFTLRR